MEKIHYFRPLYLALALTISLFSTASTPNRYKTSASLPDSALSLLDEAEARRLPHLPQFRIDMLRGTVYERQGMYHLKELPKRLKDVLSAIRQERMKQGNAGGGSAADNEALVNALDEANAKYALFYYNALPKLP